ncbi:MAG: 50S ribosomal protein L29 [Parcubacteria group bacterium GW2011_GWA2_44_12]|nr:MAG: 50S ribosomal protein L29 [Parcubacteria group bacterium GW2011_GWA2_44_12]
MLFKDLKLRGKTELEKLLSEQKELLGSYRFKVSQGQLKTVRDIRKARRTVARILTALKGT